MRIHRFAPLSLSGTTLVLLALVGACGGKSIVDEAPSTNETAIDAACASYADAVTALEVRCGGRPDDAATLKTKCVTQSNLRGAKVNPDALARCAELTKSARCASLLALLGSGECSGTGTLSDGDPCFGPNQCLGGVCRHSPTDAGTTNSPPPLTCGVCETGPKAGDPCAAGTSACAVGMFCQSGVCVDRIAKSGEACKPGSHECSDGNDCRAGTCVATQPGDACVRDNTCPVGSNCLAGRCAPLPAVEGAQCTSDGQCADLLECRLDTNVCTRRVDGKPGDACNMNKGLWCETGLCPSAADGSAIESRCPRILADGDACDTSPTADATCAADSLCVNGHCEKYDPVIPSACR